MGTDGDVLLLPDVSTWWNWLRGQAQEWQLEGRRISQGQEVEVEVDDAQKD